MTHSSPRPEAVIFDCDGVLLDTESLAATVWRDLLARHGLDISPSAFHERMVGRTVETVLGLLREEDHLDLPGTFRADLDQEFERAFKLDARVLKGVPEVLDLLGQAGIPFAVASNSDRAGLDFKLGHSGLKRHFADRQFNAEDVERPKPFPDLYRHAARQLGVDVSRCIVVEDSPTGALAGVSAGATVWGLTAASHHADVAAQALRTAGAARVFPEMAAVQAALQEVFGRSGVQE